MILPRKFTLLRSYTTTVDGNQKSGINSPVEVGSFFFCHDLSGFEHHPQVVRRVSEPSTTYQSYVTTNKSQPHDVQTPTAQLIQKNRTLLGVINISHAGNGTCSG